MKWWWQSPGDVSSAQIDWGALLAQLNVQGMAKELARNCTLESFVDGRLVLNLAPQFKHLQTNKIALDKLQATLTEYLSKPVKLLVSVGGGMQSLPLQ
ncbi:MAG: DNA polymerase III subunit gamma/tau C-terminal domain-containing protein [Nitrosomonadales bacterium]